MCRLDVHPFSDAVKGEVKLSETLGRVALGGTIVSKSTTVAD